MNTATDYFGNTYSVGDTIEFQVLIGGRKHRSKSKVYRITNDYVYISCNGIRKTFLLKHGEVIKKV
jgi:hypothetical protein